MNDSDLDTELDRDMDERLARFARSTRATSQIPAAWSRQ